MNICLPKIKAFFGRTYPSYILPKPTYLLTMDLDSMLRSDNTYIVRKSDLPLHKSFNTAKKLKAGAISIERIPFLSSNLLGGKYIAKNIIYLTKGLGSAAWKGDKIKLNDYKDCYIKGENAPIFIPTKLIHDVEVPFVASITKDNKARVKGLPFEPTEGNGMKLNGKSQLIHSPTNLNYWHVELEVRDFNDTAIKKTKNEFNEYACDYILDIISENAQMDLPQNIFKIQRKAYLAN